MAEVYYRKTVQQALEAQQAGADGLSERRPAAGRSNTAPISCPRARRRA